MNLMSTQSVLVVQRKEWAELFGFETRNKYEIFDQNQQRIGFAAEQQKGFLGLLFRQLLGHWRSFEIHFFDEQRKQIMVSRHPFRFFFQEFHIFDDQNRPIGRCEQKFGILTKKFDVYNENNQLTLTMRSGFFKFWTFPLQDSNGQQRALIQKKWSGLFTEAFTDADKFLVSYEDPRLTANERQVILALSVFTDLQYFERKANAAADID